MKRYKHTLSIFALSTLMVLGVSCEDILDETPISEVSDGTFWKTNEDADLGVISIYDALQKTYRTNHFYWGEYRADNYVVSNQPSGQTEDLINNALTPETEDYLRWNEFYKVIFRANTAIDKIPQIPQYDENLLGEAYACRAYAYFDAYRVWGGVPLFKDAALTFSDNSFKEKSTPEEVLALALSDLEEASRLIAKPTSPTRFSVASILAFKAKVYMYLNRYEEANTALNELIALNQYQLTTDRTSWRNLFLNDIAFPGEGEEGPELIMSLKYTFAEDGRRASGIYELFFQGVPSVWVSPKVTELWTTRFPTDSTSWADKYPGVPPHVMNVNPASGEEELVYGDYRYYESITEVADEQDLRISKYAKTNYSPAEDDTDIVLFRYADMLLLKAEAENKLGNPEAALALLDEVRISRGLPKVNSGALPDVNINNMDALEDFILDERQLELIAEGSRWWDLVRTDKAVEVMGPINGQTKETIIWPIYFRHLVDNPKLTQNEAYR
ncbi:RagB/SusD family nutrient uptake outer membrane protein [Formosa sp. PL04]|uniref:RagB/SusD family nutrient uptake outer membrane protein n=1 Tax=Formosa sp. PL04 TaxID=3081755 RepID=UPI002980DB12|nr:RagB/SusD family nutrient uptake outer membrane protein [Formosa sp. PL04]MDW5288146.1 RagB/SusD family nutrient uptake outer membrane protein [Formosa sp. PL04]